MAEKEEMAGEETQEQGIGGPSNWRNKLQSREDMLKYLQSGERYWYSDDWYGSEKRRTPA